MMNPDSSEQSRPWTTAAHPVLVPRPRDQLDTPALVVDLEAMEANVARMAQTCRSRGVAWRPHVKSHAIADLASRLIAAGAIGVTCAKLGEAQIMADAGIRDILIANQIVGAAKIARLMALAKSADVVVAIDDAANAEQLAAAARAQGTSIRVVVEVDVGMRRAGVLPGEPSVALARHAAGLPGLRFSGFEAWEGHASSIQDPEEKALAVADAVGLLAGTAAMCRAEGLPVDIVSCGGTATFLLTTALPGVTEVQAGGGVFGDLRCRTLYHVDLLPALTMSATVVSRPTPARIVCDVGCKSLSADPLPPQPLGLAGFRSLRLSAEHATIELAQACDTPRVGDRVSFLVGYSDSTIHLNETLYGVRGDVVEIAWPVGRRDKVV